ncbi:putative membrane protein [Rickettsia rhipicephali str. Ect]|uniref:Putative membrane protein n=1 Tax=Rickettsia rhipicephali str. Ect TaxID=1359199 RepID=A0A0F3PFE2_RICRH|nr:putative membrane protein [Rickettsia rhipicephali str. Ect]
MNFTLAIISQVIFAGVISIYMRPIPTVLVEIFPTSIRFTGVALSYNLAAAIFWRYCSNVSNDINESYRRQLCYCILFNCTCLVIFYNSKIL